MSWTTGIPSHGGGSNGSTTPVRLTSFYAAGFIITEEAFGLDGNMTTLLC